MKISEIAQLAGVSSAAVSRYLNDGYLSEEKRQSIAKVIEQTGYRPSLQAQTLRTRKTKTIGIILPRVDSSSINRVMSGAYSVLEPAGYQILLADSYNSPKKELEYLELLTEQRVDALLLFGTVFTKKHLSLLKSAAVPVVIVGQQLDGYACAYYDDYGAFYDMASRIAKTGRQHIGYIGAMVQDKSVGQWRQDGVLDALEASALQLSCQETADFTMESGFSAAQRMYSKCPELDALICATDKMAAGAMKYFHSIGVSIPQQVLLTGQGDNNLCQVTTPTLTSISYAYRDCGSAAGELLLQKLRDPNAANRQIKLAYTIVERESSQVTPAEEQTI